MPKEAVFTMKLESEVRDQFMAEADEVEHRPDSQLLGELMLKYDEFLQHKVEAARYSMQAGRGRSNDQVEAKFANQRTKALGEA